MDTYLLLRNNKQSGPYNLQQLINFGLKPYDLVWVEGKSAAWRYPSEVEGLKTYAPASEEQPFDRFFKKKEEKQENPVNPQTKTRLETYSLPIDSSVSETKIVTSNKKVFVSMPENQAPGKRVQPVRSNTPLNMEEKPTSEVKTKIEEKTKFIEPIKTTSKPIHTTDETNEPISVEKKAFVNVEPVLNEKYSESLDDIKRRYTETYLNRKKRPRWTSTHTSIAQVFGGAILFCLIVVVVYKNFSGEENSQQTRTTLIKPEKKINKDLQTPGKTTATVAAVSNGAGKSKEKKQQSTRNEMDLPNESPVAVIQKNDQSINESDYAVVTSDENLKKTETSKGEKTEEVKPRTRPVNINKLVSVSANNYKQRAFGGVMNLQLTVNNDSKFDLDRVVIELQYLKPSEQPLKTERIVFNSVAANDSKTLKIPDYLRGVKIAYRVVDIESAQYDRQTAGL